MIYLDDAINAVKAGTFGAATLFGRTDEGMTALAETVRLIKDLPATQPIEERKKGEWTNDNACPFCGFQPWYERDIHTLSYCPNCGADMRERKSI